MDKVADLQAMSVLLYGPRRGVFLMREVPLHLLTLKRAGVEEVAQCLLGRHTSLGSVSPWET